MTNYFYSRILYLKEKLSMLIKLVMKARSSFSFPKKTGNGETAPPFPQTNQFGFFFRQSLFSCTSETEITNWNDMRLKAEILGWTLGFVLLKTYG